MDDELKALADKLDEASAQGDAEVAEIQRAIHDFRETSDPSAEDHENFAERLRHEVERLEASHPDLSAAIARVIDSLTAWGL